MAQGVGERVGKPSSGSRNGSGRRPQPRRSSVIGTRRIFLPAFKLRVLDSYRNDIDCRGNQRATARKFDIHRRQIQKWLQCEDQLRRSVAAASLRAAASAAQQTSSPACSPRMPEQSGGNASAPAMTLNLGAARQRGGSPPPPGSPPSSGSSAAPTSTGGAAESFAVQREKQESFEHGALGYSFAGVPTGHSGYPEYVVAPTTALQFDRLASPEQAASVYPQLRSVASPAVSAYQPARFEQSQQQHQSHSEDEVYCRASPDSQTPGVPPSHVELQYQRAGSAVFINYDRHRSEDAELCYVPQSSASSTTSGSPPPSHYEYNASFSSSVSSSDSELECGGAMPRGPDSGRRRSFDLRFKLTVLDAFHHDQEVRKNQRATARKFGINRRQVQKWLLQEDELRGMVQLGNSGNRQRLGPIQEVGPYSPPEERAVDLRTRSEVIYADSSSSPTYQHQETPRHPPKKRRREEEKLAPQEAPLCLVKQRATDDLNNQIERVSSTVPTPPSVTPAPPADSPAKKDPISFRPYLDKPTCRSSSPTNNNSGDVQNLNEQHSLSLELSFRLPGAQPFTQLPALHRPFFEERSAFARYYPGGYPF